MLTECPICGAAAAPDHGEPCPRCLALLEENRLRLEELRGGEGAVWVADLPGPCPPACLRGVI